MIQVKNLCAGYGEKEVLHDVDVTFHPGRITVLIGPNGCGKSTLLKTLVRICSKSSGQILVDDDPIENWSSTELAKRVAYLPQSKKAAPAQLQEPLFCFLQFPSPERRSYSHIWERLF